MNAFQNSPTHVTLSIKDSRLVLEWLYENPQENFYVFRKTVDYNEEGETIFIVIVDSNEDGENLVSYINSNH